MATNSSILAWEIPWTEEPDGLQSMGPQSWTHKEADTTEYTHKHSCTNHHVNVGFPLSMAGMSGSYGV